MRCNCEKEASQQTPETIHRFGAIANQETILVAGVHSLNCQNGELLPDAFDERRMRHDDPQKNESVCRRDHSSIEEIEREIVAKLKEKDPNRKLEMVFLAKAEDIRRITVGQDEVGVFCIIDNGLETYPAHAALSFSDHVRQNKNFWKKVSDEAGRSLKAETISNLVDVFMASPCSLEEAFAPAGRAP